MKGLRSWVIATLGWFFLLYNIERVSEPINIASFVYVLAAVVAIFIIVFPWLYKIPVLWLTLMPLPWFFALKIWLGYPIGNKNLPVTVTEICALGLTALLARRIAIGLEEFRAAGIDLLVVDQLMDRAQPFETGQAEIYREIQRARLYRRPLSLLAVSAKGESVEFSFDRIKKEMQEKAIEKYVAARLANLLLEEMNDCDIITQRDDHFIVLLPEVNRESVVEVITKLSAAAQEELGLRLSFGVSTFPEQEVTFEQMLERAEEDMWLSPVEVDDSEEQRRVSGRADLAIPPKEISISE